MGNNTPITEICQSVFDIKRKRNKKKSNANGGEGGDRTLDPRLMSPLLYLLSYLAKFPPCMEVAQIIPKFGTYRQ